MSFKKNKEVLLSLPNEGMSFDDVKNVLEYYGFKIRKKSGSSHVTFSHGENRIIFPKKRGQIVIKCYLEKIVDYLYEHNYLED